MLNPSRTTPQPLDYESPAPPQHPHAAPRSSRRTLIPGALMVLAMIGAVAIVMLSEQPRTASPSLQTRCKRDLRTITQLVLAYASEHRGELPASLRQLADMKFSHFGPSQLVCPECQQNRWAAPTTQSVFAGVSDDGSISYIYLGRGMSLRGSRNRILICDRAGNHPRTQWINIAYIDGRVEGTEPKRAAKIIAELQAGHNPPRPEMLK